MIMPVAAGLSGVGKNMVTLQFNQFFLQVYRRQQAMQESIDSLRQHQVSMQDALQEAVQDVMLPFLF